MSATIIVSPMLQPFTDNHAAVVSDGATIRDCLDDLAFRYHKIQEIIFDRNGVFKIVVIVNNKVITPANLDANVSDNDEISILMPMAGG